MTDRGFCFKQFSLQQGDCAMKVGTDSVLLGAWASIPAQGNILDIGAGTGILSLMAAQRSQHARITGIEIARDAARQAQENVARSPWSARIEIINGDFTLWVDKTELMFDSILSNPPYFEQSLLSTDPARTTARHTTALRYEQIFDLSRQLLLSHGTLSLVIPVEAYRHVDETAMLYGWGASRLTQIRTTATKAPKRLLCEWKRNHYTACQKNELSIRSNDGSYSEEYINLTQDFYLNF